jgi:hypothetical protein
MENRKYLAWLHNCPDNQAFNKLINSRYLLIDNMCKNFEKIYMINLINLKFFSNKKEKYNFAINEKLKLPNNIELFIPLNSKDFANFMVGKELIGINDLTRDYNDLKIYLLLKKYKIKQVQISNVGNIQTKWLPLKDYFWKGMLWKLNHVYAHKFIVLLSNLGLISKIEIRFMTNSAIVESIKKSKNFYKRIFNHFKLAYAKEIILVNSRAFDLYKIDKTKARENLIVHLDWILDDPQFLVFKDQLDKKSIEKHYFYLEKLLKYFSNVYKKKVVVPLHPMDDLKLKKKYFPDFDVVQYQTRENILEAFIVFFFESSAILDAILFKKKIINLHSDIFDEHQINMNQELSRKIGILNINIKDEMFAKKDDLLLQLNNITEKYSNHIKTYVAPDGNNLGYEKIIKILKERFFN